MFKTGDKIICINNNGIEDELDLNAIYTVDKIRNESNTLLGENFYGIILQEKVTQQYTNTYKSSRFKYDIKYQRKQKLKEICSKSETNW